MGDELKVVEGGGGGVVSGDGDGCVNTCLAISGVKSKSSPIKYSRSCKSPLSTRRTISSVTDVSKQQQQQQIVDSGGYVGVVADVEKLDRRRRIIGGNSFRKESKWFARCLSSPFVNKQGLYSALWALVCLLSIGLTTLQSFRVAYLDEKVSLLEGIVNGQQENVLALLESRVELLISELVNGEKVKKGTELN
ncbi:hypothetical protein CHUAL_002667 [Chamberlinius hualienensis]